MVSRIGLIAGLVVFAAIVAGPSPAGMQPAAQITAAVTLLMAVWWLTEAVPVAVTASESVERLRTWASGRCLGADQAGIYRRQPQASKGQRRRVTKDPSLN